MLVGKFCGMTGSPLFLTLCCYVYKQKVPGVVEVLLSESGLDLVKDASEYEMSFVVAAFEGETFEKLRRAQVRIVGPTVLHKCVEDGMVSPEFRLDLLLVVEKSMDSNRLDRPFIQNSSSN